MCVRVGSSVIDLNGFSDKILWIKDTTGGQALFTHYVAYERCIPYVQVAITNSLSARVFLITSQALCSPYADC